MYQNLPLCRKHGSYTCRAILRNFVGNISTPLNFVRKIHMAQCVGHFRNNSVGIIPTFVGTIPTLVRIIPILVGIIPTLVEIIPTPQ